MHSAIKLAKQVLRDSRQNLVLWDGYARIERQRGKVEEARQVYITALSMYRSFSPADQIDGPLLWRAWAEMEWEEGKPRLALKVLVAASSKDYVDLSECARATVGALLLTKQSNSFACQIGCRSQALPRFDSSRSRSQSSYCQPEDSY